MREVILRFEMNLYNLNFFFTVKFISVFSNEIIHMGAQPINTENGINRGNMRSVYIYMLYGLHQD
jgi:hypothetical protein